MSQEVRSGEASPSAAAPAMRGAMTRALLDCVRKLRPADRDRVLARAGDGVMAIDAATALEWIPMRTHMGLSESLFAVVGVTRGIDVWRDAMLLSLDRPILRTFVKMSTNLFGVTPSSILRQTERLYPYLTRGIGSAAFVPGPTPRGGHFLLKAFPSAQFDFPCYVNGLQGCIEAAFALCKQHSYVRVAERDEGQGTVTYALRWQARDAA